MVRSAVILFYLLTTIVVIVQLAAWYPALPDEVPAYFDENGRPIRWDTKETFVLINAIIQGVVLVMFAVIGYAIRFVPVELFNLPNREFWLSAERREETLGVLQAAMLFVAAISSWLLIGLFQLSAYVAVGNRFDIAPEFWVFLGVYLMMIAAMVVFLLLRFRKPHESV